MDALTKAPAFDDAELELLVEVLQRLRETKEGAHATLAALPGHGHLAPCNFGIPLIDGVLRKIEALQDLGWEAGR